MMNVLYMDEYHLSPVRTDRLCFCMNNDEITMEGRHLSVLTGDRR